jgi:CTP-dependent riboflavin kinase
VKGHGDSVSRDLKGIVAAGRGLGAPRMTDPATLARIGDLAGFPPVPGTLNVVLPEPLERGLFSRYLAAAEIDPAWEAETGQAGYFLAEALVAGRFRGLAFQADEPGYPADMIELLCEVRLRETLGLSDGDPITLSVLVPGGRA